MTGKKSRGTKATRPGTLPTRERILRAAISEFSKQGFRGGRVQRIGKDSRTNLRLIYHYFGDKEGLYVATLERVYVEMRRAEQQLELAALAPLEAMRRFIDFTFDHLASHPEFIGLTLSENQQGARYVKRSGLVSSLTPPLLAVIRDLLDRGRREGVFRGDVDAVQLFVTLHSLCYLHLSHKSTLSVILHADLADPKWLAARRRHVEDVLFAYLRPPGASSAKMRAPSRRTKMAAGAARKVRRAAIAG